MPYVSAASHCGSTPQVQSNPPRPSTAHSYPNESLNTVVGDEVGGAPLEVRGRVPGGKSLDARGERRRAGDALRDGQVDGQARDVGGRHGGAAQRGGGPAGADVGGADVLAGREDVDGGAVVGEGGLAPRRVDGADGDGLGGGRGRAVGGQGVLVARGDDAEDAGVVGGADGVVEGGGVATACRGLVWSEARRAPRTAELRTYQETC